MDMVTKDEIKDLFEDYIKKEVCRQNYERASSRVSSGVAMPPSDILEVYEKYLKSSWDYSPIVFLDMLNLLKERVLDLVTHYIDYSETINMFSDIQSTIEERSRTYNVTVSIPSYGSIHRDFVFGIDFLQFKYCQLDNVSLCTAVQSLKDILDDLQYVFEELPPYLGKEIQYHVGGVRSKTIYHKPHRGSPIKNVTTGSFDLSSNLGASTHNYDIFTTFTSMTQAQRELSSVSIEDTVPKKSSWESFAFGTFAFILWGASFQTAISLENENWGVSDPPKDTDLPGGGYKNNVTTLSKHPGWISTYMEKSSKRSSTYLNDMHYNIRVPNIARSVRISGRATYVYGRGVLLSSHILEPHLSSIKDRVIQIEKKDPDFVKVIELINLSYAYDDITENRTINKVGYIYPGGLGDRPKNVFEPVYYYKNISNNSGYVKNISMSFIESPTITQAGSDSLMGWYTTPSLSLGIPCIDTIPCVNETHIPQFVPISSDFDERVKQGWLLEEFADVVDEDNLPTGKTIPVGGRLNTAYNEYIYSRDTEDFLYKLWGIRDITDYIIE